MRTVACLLLSLGPLWAQELRIAPFAQGLASPVDVQHAGDGSGRMFVVEQAGVIRILRGGVPATQPFLDIRARVSSGGERGLLGLAFPPGFAQSRRFYVNYTNLNGDTVLSLFRVSGNPELADPTSEVILLTIPQPAANHNGGQIRFGPDGYLYVGMGDGGGSGDPQNLAQNLGSLLGKMLRIDVESQPGQVRIPPDNPFVHTPGARPEIWAYGLRNPWRFSFDRATGGLWIADVGERSWEEVNYQPPSSRGGENYGWPLMEGNACFRAGCNPQGLVRPVAEYAHSGGNCSITGGFVYRGNATPGLRGTYLYGDYCTGQLFAAMQRNGVVNVVLPPLATGFRITSFGEDEAGEVYFATTAGALWRVQGHPGPQFHPQFDVVDAAAFRPGLMPGSLATVFAAGVRDQVGITQANSIPLPLSLDGVTVTVAGRPAPLLSVSNVGGIEQVNFQVPFETPAAEGQRVVVTRNGIASTLWNGVVPSRAGAPQPGIYTYDGRRAIAVHALTYTLVTQEAPLRAGDFAFVYAAGAGAVTNAPATGAGAPAAPLAELRDSVRVTLSEVPCEVQFAGLAPGLVGVYQINFRVPQGLSAGLRDLVLTVAGVDSPPVQLPVR
jgi:uncharacterized protein (TIGR03437 family)